MNYRMELPVSREPMIKSRIRWDEPSRLWVVYQKYERVGASPHWALAVTYALILCEGSYLRGKLYP